MSKKIKFVISKREFNDVIEKALDYAVEKYRLEVENGDAIRDSKVLFDVVLLTPVLNGMNWALHKRNLENDYNLMETASVIRRLALEHKDPYAVDLSQEISDEDILNDHRRKQLKDRLLKAIKGTALCDRYQITMELDSQNRVHADTITVDGMISDLGDLQ